MATLPEALEMIYWFEHKRNNHQIEGAAVNTQPDPVVGIWNTMTSEAAKKQDRLLEVEKQRDELLVALKLATEAIRTARIALAESREGDYWADDSGLDRRSL